MRDSLLEGLGPPLGWCERGLNPGAGMGRQERDLNLALVGRSASGWIQAQVFWVLRDAPDLGRSAGRPRGGDQSAAERWGAPGLPRQRWDDGPAPRCPRPQPGGPEGGRVATPRIAPSPSPISPGPAHGLLSAPPPSRISPAHALLLAPLSLALSPALAQSRPHTSAPPSVPPIPAPISAPPSASSYPSPA